MQHSFDVEIAKQHGVVEAIILQNIWFWVTKNKEAGKNYFDGKYWTYSTSKALAEQFPYLSQWQITRAIAKLKNDGLIETGNFNRVKMDRTLWYTITEKTQNAFSENAKSILQNCKMQIAETQNPFCKIAKAIPYINTDINTDSKTDDVEEEDENKSSSALDYWEANMGLLNSVLVEHIKDLVAEVGFMAFKKAVNKSITNNKRSFAYVQKTARGIANGNDFDEINRKESGDVWGDAYASLYGGERQC